MWCAASRRQNLTILESFALVHVVPHLLYNEISPVIDASVPCNTHACKLLLWYGGECRRDLCSGQVLQSYCSYRWRCKAPRSLRVCNNFEDKQRKIIDGILRRRETKICDKWGSESPAHILRILHIHQKVFPKNAKSWGVTKR